MFTPRPNLSDSNRDNAWKNVVTKNMNQLMDGSGWIPVGDELTLSSATTNPTTYVMNCANANQKFQVGDKIRLTQNSSVKYFYVVAVTSTTVTLCAGSDYVVQNTTTYPISGVAYSRVERPWGFPTVFNWSPAFVGFSSNPTGTFIFSLKGGICEAEWEMSGYGTSNSTTCALYLPVTHATGVAIRRAVQCIDNGSLLSNGGVGFLTSGSAICYAYLTWSGGGWTASGAKGFNGGMRYTI